MGRFTKLNSCSPGNLFRKSGGIVLEKENMLSTNPEEEIPLTKKKFGFT